MPRVGKIAAALLRRYRHARLGGIRAHRVAMRWIVPPAIAPGDRVCLFVLVPVAGGVLPHSLDHAAAWRAAGYKVVAIAAVASVDDPVDPTLLAQVDGLAVRRNQGYDFGAWAVGIAALLPALRQAGTLALSNDSVLGPSAAFPAMLERVARSGADLIGLVESREVRRHFQSFTLFFRPGALHAPAFAAFWRRVRSGDRQFVIDHYETRLVEAFEAAGLRTETLFASPDPAGNPTLRHWRALLGAGFPYLKVQLLRDNPAGVPLADWRAQAAAAGFDTDRLDSQIEALQRSGNRKWQV